LVVRKCATRFIPKINLMRTPMTENERTACAYHEASHAVIARVQGVECIQVLMSSPIEGLAAGAQIVKASYGAFDGDQAALLAVLKKETIVSLAGPCGEMKYRNKPWDKKYFRRWNSDFESAQRSARRAALTATGVSIDHPPRNIERDAAGLSIHRPTAEQIAYADEVGLECMATASDLVEAHWPAIERVAQTLMKCDRLDQAELDRLITQAGVLAEGSSQ
jgi:hypothetical protein